MKRGLAISALLTLAIGIAAKWAKKEDTRISPKPSQSTTATHPHPTSPSSKSLAPPQNEPPAELEVIRQQYLEKVPPEIRADAKGALEVSGPGVWMIQLEVAGTRVAFSDARIAKDAHGSWRLNGPQLPALPKVTPVFPEISERSFEELIRNELRRQDYELATARLRERLWMPQRPSDLIPYCDFEVKFLNAKKQSRQEIWRFDALTRKILGRSEAGRH